MIKIIKNYMLTYIFNLVMLLLSSRANDVSAQHKTQKGSNAQGLTSAAVKRVTSGFNLIKNFIIGPPGNSRRAARARRRRDQHYLLRSKPKRTRKRTVAGGYSIGNLLSIFKAKDGQNPARREREHKMRSALRSLQPDHSPFDRRRRAITGLIVMSVMAMRTENMSIKHHKAYFDTDSKSIGIDNRCSACISHDLNDFVGEVYKTDRVIKGFAGTRTTNVKNKMLLIVAHIQYSNPGIAKNAGCYRSVSS